MAMFAFTSDIAARSGSSSPASSSSSSFVRFRYSWGFSPMSFLPSLALLLVAVVGCSFGALLLRARLVGNARLLLVALVDVRRLLGVGDRRRVVAEDVQRGRGVDRRGDVRV